MPQHRNTLSHIAKEFVKPALSHFSFSYRTIACERHPTRNEDSILVDERTGLLAVFDGVGGSAAGEIASQTAQFAALQQWRRIMQQQQKGRKVLSYPEVSEQLDLCTLLEQLIYDADDQVRTEGARRAGTDDLATTVALAAIFREAEAGHYTLYYAHVGDSRIYLLRNDQPLQRLTKDDGLLAKLVENRIIDEENAFSIDQAKTSDQLSETELSYFRLRGGITQALGGPLPPTIHISQISIQPGDRVLLCTDGIHDNLTDDEIEHILRSTPRNVSARELVHHSLNRSHESRSETIRAKPDDMSAIVVTCRF
ncbi:PP2C family protein-serine/threonine phosphatase [Ktedonospora formicarum]|uniref:Protein phosphatase n=1 Tax=Ktedonospora formicarum TaxID=2778364 RepID=A0A8J3I5X2_9CHLR|nr:PP2C family serine/threonine-protein phosphatase [Ktedonospora formicarum]GHO50189.1 protein phosphatase [Ktedonospora formicarum]